MDVSAVFEESSGREAELVEQHETSNVSSSSPHRTHTQQGSALSGGIVPPRSKHAHQTEVRMTESWSDIETSVAHVRSILLFEGRCGIHEPCEDGHSWLARVVHRWYKPGGSYQAEVSDHWNDEVHTCAQKRLSAEWRTTPREEVPWLLRISIQATVGALPDEAITITHYYMDETQLPHRLVLTLQMSSPAMPHGENIVMHSDLIFDQTNQGVRATAEVRVTLDEDESQLGLAELRIIHMLMSSIAETLKCFTYDIQAEVNKIARRDALLFQLMVDGV